MTLTFEITGFCVAKDADKKPNELELAEAIAALLAEQIGGNCIDFRKIHKQRSESMKIKLDAHGIMPERAHATDAGMDIKSPCDVYVPADGGCIIHTGVHVELPKDTAGMLVSKSGLNVKHGITTTGLIDEGYSGEIVVRMDNHGNTGYLVHKGDKITQLIVIPVYYEEIELVDSISGSERGNSGFGSSGR